MSEHEILFQTSAGCYSVFGVNGATTSVWPIRCCHVIRMQVHPPSHQDLRIILETSEQHTDLPSEIQAANEKWWPVNGPDPIRIQPKEFRIRYEFDNVNPIILILIGSDGIIPD